MIYKKIMTGILFGSFALLPLVAQVQPGDAEDTSVADAVEEHEKTSAADELFASEFDSLLDGDESVAFFAPEDEVLDEEDTADASGDELESFFNGHVATGLASQEPLEHIKWFVTDDGEKVTVSEEDGTIVLNDSVEVVDAIPASNGVVYVTDESLN